MKALATLFSGAILVFATLKQSADLSQGEIERLAELTLWGREYLKDVRRARAPVILLTGTELFASHSLHEAWKAAGGRHAQFSEAGRFRDNNLRVLADLTNATTLSRSAVLWCVVGKGEEQTLGGSAQRGVNRVNVLSCE
jgi:hypothetical protein